MAISNAASDSASAPHQFDLQPPDAGTLAEAQARHGKLPDGQQIVGVHRAMPGISYSLATKGDQIHVVVTRAAEKTSDAPLDAALNPAVAEARNRIIQARNVEFWNRPSHLR